MRVRVIGVATTLAMTVLLPGAVQAQLNYRNAFLKLYGVKPDSKLAKAGCLVCHYGNDLKNRNGYGEAVAKALGKEKATDDEVTEAMKKVEAQEVRIKLIDLLKIDAPPTESKPAEPR